MFNFRIDSFSWDQQRVLGFVKFNHELCASNALPMERLKDIIQTGKYQHIHSSLLIIVVIGPCETQLLNPGPRDEDLVTMNGVPLIKETIHLWEPVLVEC